jgi:ABC-type uncharacterized transport system substrate-binding protein
MKLRQYVDAGGLISYGANIIQIWRQAAGFIDKILKGAKPADLLIEQPTKFRAGDQSQGRKALGLTVPPSLRVLADELISSTVNVRYRSTTDRRGSTAVVGDGLLSAKSCGS